MTFSKLFAARATKAAVAATTTAVADQTKKLSENPNAQEFFQGAKKHAAENRNFLPQGYNRKP